MPRIRILSIDGGGMRGIIPAVFLAKFEEITRRPIAGLFDLIAGTSTGGILALGLTLPEPSGAGRPQYAARDLIDFYQKEGPEIFAPSIWKKLHPLGLIRQLNNEKYEEGPLEEVLRRFFGPARLSAALTEVLIPTYDIRRRAPYFFKRREAQKPGGQDFAMWQVARATSAAPTYFDPCLIRDAAGLAPYAFIDGGVMANNPAMCAYAEAKVLHREATEFLVVSLGTGKALEPIRPEDDAAWGLLDWAPHLVDVFMDSMWKTVDYQMEQLLPGRYYRFQIDLAPGREALDDASPETLAYWEGETTKKLEDMERRGFLKEFLELLLS